MKFYCLFMYFMDIYAVYTKSKKILSAPLEVLSPAQKIQHELSAVTLPPQLYDVPCGGLPGPPKPPGTCV